MLDSSELISLVMMHTLGLSILSQVFKTAAWGTFSVSQSKRKECHDCYAWIQGSGLDIHLQRFGLYYDAEQLRESFNYMIKHKSA